MNAAEDENRDEQWAFVDVQSQGTNLRIVRKHIAKRKKQKRLSEQNHDDETNAKTFRFGKKSTTVVLKTSFLFQDGQSSSTQCVDSTHRQQISSSEELWWDSGACLMSGKRNPRQ